ncbi:hypothetical protein SAMN04487895_12328 [Paenibacillus sophorae]|uniref:Uncharacterized protein n=1 Tax=Paenibacillus sophorae TaxID=1333845 RepID=A0A1H8VD81_9BACL|nr:hypothetical protein [Paenibacillus sophorae]QWU16678.1 hypothetical protein KP014_05515 [Paenibacillus sophorae]SEP13406.1 hypothetical protein SAMN04487895_12328 [Paenibacillus sophorae]
MTETMNMQIEAAPGVLTAVWTPVSGTAAKGHAKGEGVMDPQQASPKFRHVLKMEVWPLSRRREVVERLAESPHELYGLLKGCLPAWLAELGLWPDDSELSDPTDADKEAGDKAAMAKVRERLAKEPLTALALRGLPKGELTDAVFALWARDGGAASAEETGPVPAAALSAELARLEKKGTAVSAGEWLAEAAAEGSLHQPGPLFPEVRDRPVPVSPSLPPHGEDWQPLLPNVPRANEGLELIMRRAAEAAARRAKDLAK